MTVSALIACLGAGIALAVAAPVLVRSMRPASATMLLTAGALAVSACAGFIACILGFETVAGIPFIAAAGGWSVRQLHGSNPAPWAGLLAGAVVSVLLIRSLTTFVGQGRSLWRSAAACRQMPNVAGLVITDDAESPHALAGFPGRVVVGAPVLAALGPGHRRALIAHEQAHLVARHHVYLQLVEVATAANPILRPVRRAVRLSTERWADEMAADQTGDRRVVAGAIVAAATSVTSAEATTTRLASAEDAVAYRVRVLLQPRRRTRLPAAVLGALLVIVPAGAAAVAAHTAEGAFERAHAQLAHAHPPQVRGVHRSIAAGDPAGSRSHTAAQ
ncbi:M48 family metalloprotease [Allobranchiibius sp. CTAmp26]|uniref:M48 family metalloprotease n=1 Tax=Allobranchiibius sp. CTAmp26 TaxID=2815214 RepID=UPI001AA12079|nr:M48 family metalloprotease [Allobranchiibius sp. CTAmp26]MBO1753805.1 hypothetical protein [Allobranchiibius sp. CTAmp26]